jgi:FkbM family methyltransferase
MDYLQIDLDVDNKSTLETLILLNETVFDTYKFATITFEHDCYRGDFYDTRNISREIFKSRGYVLVFPDVCTEYGGEGWRPFEDWYVHPDLVDMDFIHKVKQANGHPHIEISNILYNEMNSSFYFSFHGEEQYGKCVDNVLRDYFPNYEYKGVYFDIGAFEPIQISNSYHFERNGWDCHLFEANTNSIPLLKEHRKNVYNYAISNENKDEITFNIVTLREGWTASYSAIHLDEEYKQIFGGFPNECVTQITVPQRTINHIIETEIPHIKKIDIISLDIEGGEMNCLYGIDFNKYNPSVLVIENVTGNKQIEDYLSQYGYSLDKHISYNQYYISKNFKTSIYK